MKRHTAIALTLSLLAGIALALGGCCPLLQTADVSEDATGGVEEGASAEKGKPTLGEFLDADSKTGEYEIHTEWYEGDTVDLTGEFWVDGRLFRYDIYEEGTLVRSVVSPDGETAYFCFHETQVCQPSVASVDYYLMRYTMPTGGGAEDGTDDETGATRVVYSVQKTDDMPGSEHPWYSEDVTYLVMDDEVIGAISRGASPNDDGSIGGLDTNRELWSNVRVGVRIPAETFELPYPIQQAD